VGIDGTVPQHDPADIERGLCGAVGRWWMDGLMARFRRGFIIRRGQHVTKPDGTPVAVALRDVKYSDLCRVQDFEWSVAAPKSGDPVDENTGTRWSPRGLLELCVEGEWR